MKNLYVHGSFINDNFGDYLLFATVMETLVKFRDNINIFSANVDSFYKNFIEYESYSYSNAIKKADMAVFAGGGYFGEPNQHKLYWNCRMLLKHALPAIKLIINNKPVCILGVGAGPLSYKLTQKVVAYIFNNAEVVSVRDEESKKFLIEYGVTRKINVVPDWIMGTKQSELLKDNHSAHGIGDNKILIHLASKNTGENSPINKILKDIKQLRKHYGFEFLIITDQADNSQIERAQKTLNYLKGCDVELYKYHDPYELCSVINNSRAVITDKLHVGIVAARFGKPAFSVAYHNKTIRFYRQVRREQFCVPIEKVTDGMVKDWILNHLNDELHYEEILKKATENRNLLEQFVKTHV